MDKANTQCSDIVVLFVNIDEWNSPVTQQYKITSIPHFKIYDSSGTLLVEGSREGGRWFQENHPELLR